MFIFTIILEKINDIFITYNLLRIIIIITSSGKEAYSVYINK